MLCRFAIISFLLGVPGGLFCLQTALAAEVHDLVITGGTGGAGLDVSENSDPRQGSDGAGATILYGVGGIPEGGAYFTGYGPGGKSNSTGSTGGWGTYPTNTANGGPSGASQGGKGGNETGGTVLPGNGGSRVGRIFDSGYQGNPLYIGAGGGGGATNATMTQSGAGGGGGGGLLYMLDASVELGFRTISLRGGDGGAGGSVPSTISSPSSGGGGGGGGGGAYMDARQVGNLVVAQMVTLYGGGGGAGGDDTMSPAGIGGWGGSGGKALLRAKNLYVVGEQVGGNYSNKIQLISGIRGADGGRVPVPNGGAGGIVALEVSGDLYTRELDFVKKDGGVHAFIRALNLTGSDSPMAITFQNSAGDTPWSLYDDDSNSDGDSIVIGDMKFAYGNSLSFDITESASSPESVMTLGGGIFVNRNVDRAAIYNSENLESQYIARGKELMFIVGSFLKNGDVFLQVQDQGNVNTGGIVIDNTSKVRMGTTNGRFLANFGVGNSTTLIQNVQGTYSSAETTDIPIGSSVYRFDVATKPTTATRGDLVATLREQDTSGGKTYNLSNISRITLLDNGQEYQIDILANEQDSLYFQNIQSPPRTVPPGPTFYVSGGGGNNTANPFCSVDMMDYHLHVGAKWHRELGTAKAVFGAFFEAGWGDYDTDDNLPYWGRVRSSGDVRAQGGGVMGTVAFANGFGVDASLKAGHIYSDMHTGSLGPGAKYDYSTYYLGAHLGAFYNIGLTQKSHVRLYGRFMWHFQPSKTLHSDAGEEIKTDLAMSSRLRAGARYVHYIGKGFHAFADAAYEYQADGRAMQRIDGVRAQGLRLNGHYGVFKVGVSWKQRRLEECGKGWDASFNTWYITDRKHGLNFGGHVGYTF